MTSPATDLTRRIWIKAETSYDTYVALAATDGVDADLQLVPDISYTKIESHVGTASVQGFIPGDQDNKWNCETLIRPGALGVAPDIGALLAHALGAETIVGGTSVVYEIDDTCPSAGLEFAAHAGSDGQYYARGNGGWAESLTIEASQGSMPKIKASGGYATHSAIKAGAACTAVEDAGESIIAVDSDEAACLAGEPIVKFDTEDNGGDGYQVTSIDYAADTFTVSPVLVGPTEIGDKIYPVVPSHTLTGTPIGIQHMVTIGGVEFGILKATISMTLSIKPRRDGSSDVPVGLIGPVIREFTGELELYEREVSTPVTGAAWFNGIKAVNLRLGPDTPGARCKPQMPACQLKVVKENWSTEDGLRVTLAFMAKQSAVAGDEFSLIFD